MKNKTLPQAVLFAQGKKALKGEVGDHTDTEVRKKGLGRLVRRGGALATGAAVVIGVVAPAVGQQNKTSAEQVRQDKAEHARVLSNPGPGLSVTEGVPIASVPVAPESTGSTSPESEPASTGEATAPAAAPTEGDWTPTPGAVTPSPESYQGQNPDTGGVPAEPAGSETGGVTSK